MNAAPQFVAVNYRLEDYELISGEPVFLVPRDDKGEVCNFTDAALVEAYTYNHVPVYHRPIHPCGHFEWDEHALCLSEGRLCPAVIAIGVTAELMQQNGVGYFSRNPLHDLRWEEHLE